MISFEDLILILYTWVPSATIGGNMKNLHFKQHFVIICRILNQKIMVSIYQSIFFQNI